jgi:hypothetical protein
MGLSSVAGVRPSFPAGENFKKGHEMLSDGNQSLKGIF